MDISKKRIIAQVNHKNSGYIGGVDSWRGFLSCWLHHPVFSSPDKPPSAISGQIRPVDADGKDIARKIAAAEKRLGVTLPLSYREFVFAFAASEKNEITNGENGVGLLPLDKIGFMRDLMPLDVKLALEHSSNSVDADYLRYGIGQDEATLRSTYVANGILIGTYGWDSYETIVIYPQLVTEDGEMEAALGLHAGQFRTPSFAELMRQLSYLELAEDESMPPYSQKQLLGTCADRLLLKNVWWK